MKNKKSVIALIISAALIITIIFSAGYIVTQSDHDCIGRDCQICAKIYSFVHWLQEFGLFYATLTISFLGTYLHKLISNFIFILEPKTTLVSLKIKLSC